MDYRTGIGQDSHAFEAGETLKPLCLGGVVIEGARALAGNSDADVVLHALTNAVSGITAVNILGPISDKMCLEEGITDSRAYVAEALRYLKGWRVTHVSFTLECAVPRINPHIPDMRASIAALLDISPESVGITATTGEELTAFGRGEGIQCFCVLTACR